MRILLTAKLESNCCSSEHEGALPLCVSAYFIF